MNLWSHTYVYNDVKPIIACLFAAALLLALPQISHADQFTQIQNSPNTYWVPAPAGQGQAQAPNPQSGSGAGPYAYYPQPGYVAGPPPYYYGPPAGYYAPPAAYYGPPPVSIGYYGGHYGSHVVVGIPGLFFGFHFH